MARGPAVAAAAEVSAGGVLSQALRQLTLTQQREHMELVVVRLVRELSAVGSVGLDASTPLMQAGLDSLASTELSMRLRALAALPLSPTLVFEHPTPRAIAVHIVEQLGGLPL